MSSELGRVIEPPPAAGRRSIFIVRARPVDLAFDSGDVLRVVHPDKWEGPAPLALSGYGELERDNTDAPDRILVVRIGGAEVALHAPALDLRDVPGGSVRELPATFFAQGSAFTHVVFAGFRPALLFCAERLQGLTSAQR